MNLRLRERLRIFYRALFPEGESAALISGSVFLGVFIAVLPTIGLALPLTLLATSICGLPKGPGLIASFVATPPTLFLFFYPLGYLLGDALTAPPSANIALLDELQKLTPGTVQAVLGHLWHDARPHVLAFLLGSLIVSLLTASLVAALSYFIMVRRRVQSPP